MINAKKLYSTLLQDNRITALISENNILNSYPNKVVDFPCLIFVDENQADTEYYENQPGASNCNLMIHIFSKKLDGYVTTSEVAIVIAEILHENLWNCPQNREVSDPDPDVEHRIMFFNKSIFLEN